MPGQEKWFLIITRIIKVQLPLLEVHCMRKSRWINKNKIKLEKKNVNTKEAEGILKKISENTKSLKSSEIKKEQKKQKTLKKKK